MKFLKELILKLNEIGLHLTAQSPSDGWKREKLLAVKNSSDRLEAVRRNIVGSKKHQEIKLT